MQILKVISALMCYPTEDLRDASAELRRAIEGAKEIPPSSRQAILGLVGSLGARDMMDVQEEYGFLFDRGRSLSLLLFEHVHGESRDRGQAMVDLMALYEKNGFAIDAKELPDYIPLYLEYLAQRPDLEAREGLHDISHILGLLSARLQERQSSYHCLFDALLIIAGAKVDIEDLKQIAANEERDDTPEAMDKVWEEEQVTFMGNQQPSSCSTGSYRPAQDPNLAVPLRIVESSSMNNTEPRVGGASR